jgi:prepilin-type processing-associated H-X9-DG protein
VLTVTETPASPYSFPFDVVQGTSADELGIVSLIIDPANNNTWGPNSNTTLVPVFVACETNLEPASQNPYQFDCNIAFADGSVQSYWVSYNQTHTDFVATKRTY